MDVVRNANGSYAIIHDGKEIDETFATEEAAWAWADEHIDDQMFDTPNDLSPPLRYRKGA